MGRKIHNVAGKRFGFATVICEDGRTSCGSVLWLCKCDCGKYFHTTSSNLVRGTTKSCGCYSSRCTRNRNIENTIYKTPDEVRLSHIWRDMLRRCEKTTDPAYCNYGGRGINVCASWKEFDNFKEWAIKTGYHSSLTIDRIDNNAGYSPNNCRWATVQEQANNRRNNLIVEYNGETRTITEWSRILNKRMKTLRWRIFTAGWDVKRAFSTPCAEASK